MNNIQIYTEHSIKTLDDIANIQNTSIYYIFFSMKNCNPCQELENYIINLFDNNIISKDVCIYKILINELNNVEFTKISNKYHIYGAPTLLAINNNHIHDRIDGLNKVFSVDKIKTFLTDFFSIQINNDK